MSLTSCFRPASIAATISAPDRFDVYYGMADNRIGVARLDVPERLPSGGIAHPTHGTGSVQSEACRLGPKVESRIASTSEAMK